MITAVVAVDKNFGIGNDNKLLVSIPEDIKNFKRLTTNNVVIMGRKTYDSLPIKPLPNRINIVITSKANEKNEEYKDNVFFVSMDFIKTFLKTLAPRTLSINYFIIGGGMIYKELLPYCEKVYMTKINNVYDNVDTYFPNIDDTSEWKLTMSSDIREHNNIEYQFCIYNNEAR